MSSTELAKSVCVKCNQEKPETEFYLLAHDGYARHRMQVCTECHEARVRRRTVERKQELGETTAAAMTGLYEAETKNGAPDNWPRPRRMLNEKQVLEIIPVGPTTLYRMEKAGRFPRSTYISPNRRVWFEDEIVAWQRAVDEFDPCRGRGKGRRHRASD